MRGRLSLVLISSSIIWSALGTDGMAAAPASCRRVLPPTGFARHQFADPDTVMAYARIGRDGERGVVLARVFFDEVTGNATYQLQRLAASGDGDLAVASTTDLEPPYVDAFVRALVVQDVDGDRLDDVVVTWANPYSPSAYAIADLYLGVSDDPLQLAIREYLGFAPKTADPVLGDFDGDGMHELALLWKEYDYSYPLLKVLKYAAGTWTPIVNRFAEVSGTFGLAVVDQNQDGVDDLALFDRDIALVWWGASDEPLQTRSELSLGFSALEFRTRDSKIVAVQGWIEPIYWYFVEVHWESLHEYGPELQETWSQPIEAPFAGLYPSLDIDGDGHQELLQGIDYGLYYFLYRGTQVRWGADLGIDGDGPRLGTPSPPIAAIDLDNDGTRDLVTADMCSITQPRQRENHDGALSTPFYDAQRWDEPYGYTAAGDFNEDGLDDVIAQTLYDDHSAIGLARGDGGFELREWPASPYDLVFPIAVDVDQDGHLDLISQYDTLRVAYGRGDGEFDLTDVGTFNTGSRVFGDVDGDGDLDVLDWRRDSSDRFKTLFVLVNEGRAFRETGPLIQLKSRGWDVGWPSADLDGDGRADVLVTKLDVLEPSRERIFWIRSLPDGTFAELRPFPHDQLGPSHSINLQVVDFDLDGTDDLLVDDIRTFIVVGEYVSLRSNGRELKTVWRRDAREISKWRARVADVDGDGRPDLIAGNDDAYFYPSYQSTVWRGDGLGGFAPLGAAAFGVSPGAVGHFRRGAGLDIARVRLVNATMANLELFFGEGRVKSADEEPPSVEIAIAPVFDRTNEPERFDGRWQVTTIPIDDCDDRPVIERRVVALLALPLAAPTQFQRGSRREIRIFEVPGKESERSVLLIGPDELAMRSLLARGRQSGGFEFEHWGTPLDLASTAAYGVERGPSSPNSRLVQRFSFDDSGRLIAATQTHKRYDLQLEVAARDRAGHHGVTRAGFQVLRRAALDAFCREGVLDASLCR